MNKNIIITKADTDSSCAIAKLEELCFTVPWSEKSVDEFLTSDISVCFIATDTVTSETVGYIGFYLVCGEANITNVAVHPKFRNKGIASSLIAAAISFCRKKKVLKMTLEVRESNDAALSLYKKIGFYEVGKRINYYTNPKENAILMDLVL